MSEDLVLEELVLFPIIRRQLGRRTSPLTIYSFEIAIAIRNISKRALFAISSARHLRYNAEHSLLTVGFSEPELLEKNPRLQVRLPATVAVEPGERHMIKARIPLKLRSVLPQTELEANLVSELGQPNIIETDLHELKRISVNVAYGIIPFKPKIGERVWERSQAIRKWSSTTERTFDCQIPPSS